MGGVVIQRSDESDDTSFWGENFLDTPEVQGVADTIAALAERFGDRIYIVSKCGKETEERTRQWLAHNAFFQRSGMPSGNVRFCRERSDKAGICTELSVTHFVDDRLEVLSYLEDVPHRFLFQAREDEVARHAEFLDRVTRVDSWSEVRTAILNDAEAGLGG